MGWAGPPSQSWVSVTPPHDPNWARSGVGEPQSRQGGMLATNLAGLVAPPPRSPLGQACHHVLTPVLLKCAFCSCGCRTEAPEAERQGSEARHVSCVGLGGRPCPAWALVSLLGNVTAWLSL